MKKTIVTLLAICLFSGLVAQPKRSKNSKAEIDTTEDPCVTRIDSIVDFALGHIGATYKYGAAGPKHFDCSGLVYYTFNHFGIKLYRSSRDQYTNGISVKKSELQKGDLVFFKRGSGIGHVGIVIEVDKNGNFAFVHASTYKRGIRIDNSTQEGYVNTYVGARRIIVCDSSLITGNTTATMEMLTEPESMDISATIVAGDSSAADPPLDSTQIDKQEKQEKISIYTVKKGDTLYGIAKRNKVTVEEIKKWNNLKNDRINIGQKLKIKKK
ncbi:NlpC/P60 family protein [Bacteroidales bacterium OttesenSCG-928-B11]|nr:NlpC/P60 family protein [Bacteroidales bacterium OttesenSCG-928-B11]MDL2326350.1 NlpC/P60 family protein [Bacteroidales bacterium OttesenSCG-928-A14]